MNIFLISAGFYLQVSTDLIKPSARMRSGGYGSRPVCVCVSVSRPLICDSRN